MIRLLLLNKSKPLTYHVIDLQFDMWNSNGTKLKIKATRESMGFLLRKHGNCSNLVTTIWKSLTQIILTRKTALLPLDQ